MRSLYSYIVEERKTWYHVSTNPDIEKFEIRNHKGMGTSFYGAGIYCTSDKKVVDYYRQAIPEDTYVYQLEIDMRGMVDEYDPNGLELYSSLMDKYNDEVVVSEKMVKQHVNGIHYISPEDGIAIVVYNPKSIKSAKLIDWK